MVLISILEGLFPIISIFSITLIGSIYSYAFVLVISTVIFFFLLIYKKQLSRLKTPHAQKDLLLTSFFITTLFILIFLSLRYTSAGNVAVLLFLQLLFSYLYFNFFGSQKMSVLHTFAAFMMGIGAIIMLQSGKVSFNLGDLLALSAAAIAPIANFYQRSARLHVSAIVILTYRNFFALPIVFALAFAFEPAPTFETFSKALPYLFLNTILVYVLAKIFWIEALHRISITKMSAMLAFAPIFTLFFANIFLGESLGMIKILAIIPILLGGYLITKKPSA